MKHCTRKRRASRKARPDWNRRAPSSARGIARSRKGTVTP